MCMSVWNRIKRYFIRNRQKYRETEDESQTKLRDFVETYTGVENGCFVCLIEFGKHGWRRKKINVTDGLKKKKF